MCRGTAWFTAGIKGIDKVRFRPFPYDPNAPGIDRIELDGTDGVSINGSVHFSVNTADEGRRLAKSAHVINLVRMLASVSDFLSIRSTPNPRSAAASRST